MLSNNFGDFAFAPDRTARTSSVVAMHHFTVDVEEYFQVSAFEGVVPQSAWEQLESRVGRGVARLLELLAQNHAKGTFFFVGWVADRQRQLVREIAAAGHEVASHTWDHRRVTHQTPHEFRVSVRRTKDLLEDVTGAPVVGFRAPSFSIVRGREWALDILIEEGYRYDSSLFPVRRPGYGFATGLRDPHWLHRPAGALAEFPPAVLRRWRVNWPAAGGTYFRLLPYQLVRSALTECGARGVPGTFYLHPWELDPEQPRLSAPWFTQLRHYGGLGRTLPRLKRLLGEFRFTSIGATLAAAESRRLRATERS